MERAGYRPIRATVTYKGRGVKSLLCNWTLPERWIGYWFLINHIWSWHVVHVLAFGSDNHWHKHKALYKQQELSHYQSNWTNVLILLFHNSYLTKFNYGSWDVTLFGSFCYNNINNIQNWHSYLHNFTKITLKHLTKLTIKLLAVKIKIRSFHMLLV